MHGCKYDLWQHAIRYVQSWELRVILMKRLLVSLLAFRSDQSSMIIQVSHRDVNRDVSYIFNILSYLHSGD